MTFGEYKGVDMCYIVSTRHQMYIMDVENYLYKTKGAYDSFESGAAADGWLTTIADDLKITEKGATDGRYALLIDANRIASRPLHYMESGRVSFDLYISDMGEGFGFELQSSFTDMFRHELSASPISITADKNGVLRTRSVDGERELGVSLRLGANTICFSFDGESKKATLEVNGEVVPVDFLGKEKSVCFATFFTNKNTELSLDRFIAVREK
jgi:AraC-like DNA-binding protein